MTDMGTRADFYVGRGENAEWLGSIARDGDVCSVFRGHELMLDKAVTLTEDDWRQWMAKFLAGEKDSALPERGWPWRWEDSRATDCVYAWDGGKVWQARGLPKRWYPVDPDDQCLGLQAASTAPLAVFPNMKERQNVTYDPRSGPARPRGLT